MSAARNAQGFPMQLTHYVSPALAEEIRAHIVSQMHLFVDKGLLNVPPGTRFVVDADFRPFVEDMPIKDEFADEMPVQQHQAVNLQVPRASPSPEPVLISKGDFELLLFLLYKLPDPSHCALEKVRGDLAYVLNNDPPLGWDLEEICDQVDMAMNQFRDDIESVEHYARNLDGMQDTDLGHGNFAAWFPQTAARLCGLSAAAQFDGMVWNGGLPECHPAKDIMDLFRAAADPAFPDSDLFFDAFKSTLRDWVRQRRESCPPPGLVDHMHLLRRKIE